MIETVPIVQPIAGEPMRFYVRSRTAGEEPWLVDLEEFDGNGHCFCQDFQFRHLPEVARRIRKGPDKRCWHIERAAEFVKADAILDGSIRSKHSREFLIKVAVRMEELKMEISRKSILIAAEIWSIEWA